VLLVLGLVAVFMLKPKKPSKQELLAAAEQNAALAQAPGYAELPASTEMQLAMANDEAFNQQAALDAQRRTIVLPPPPTTPEREQAIATVEQRPEAAVRVVRSWLRQ
jgi:flagellar M-ring protein FliF